MKKLKHPNAPIMKIVSAAAFIASFGLMLFGLFSPGARWFLPFGFVLTVSIGISSLGFWATQDLDVQDRAGASPESPFKLPQEDGKGRPRGHAA